MSWDHLGKVQSKRPTLGAHFVSHTSTPSAANCLSPKYSSIISVNIDSAAVILALLPSRVAVKHESGLNAAQDGCFKNGRRSISYWAKLRKRPVNKRAAAECVPVCERLPLETGSIKQLISAGPPAVPAPAVSDVNIHHRLQQTGIARQTHTSRDRSGFTHTRN